MLAVAERKNRIPLLLRSKGWTSYRLARRIGAIPHNIKDLVESPAIPDGTNYITLRKIAEELGVKIDDLEALEETEATENKN